MIFVFKYGATPYKNLVNMLVTLLCTTAVFSGVRPRPAPVLNIDREGISCAGISSGADFSVQFATAFSAHIAGVGVFAGQPFHCAATRFPLDQVVAADACCACVAMVKVNLINFYIVFIGVSLQ